jgi:Uma2 family endonuclease
VDEYLRNEQESQIKHEYQGGYGPMVGASDAHVIIAGNVFVALREKLADTACRVYISDMKLRIEAADAFYYSDVFVTCDARDREGDYYKPCLSGCHTQLLDIVGRALMQRSTYYR